MGAVSPPDRSSRGNGRSSSSYHNNREQLDIVSDAADRGRSPQGDITYIKAELSRPNEAFVSGYMHRAKQLNARWTGDDKRTDDDRRLTTITHFSNRSTLNKGAPVLLCSHDSNVVKVRPNANYSTE